MTSLVAIAWIGIVVHHSGTLSGTAASIDRNHRVERGWDMIGYHFVIQRDGSIYSGRPLTKAGAHARTGKPYSRNRTHIGICLIGRDEFAGPQVAALKALVGSLRLDYPIKTVERHHERCPGPGLDLESMFGKPDKE